MKPALSDITDSKRIANERFGADKHKGSFICFARRGCSTVVHFVHYHTVRNVQRDVLQKQAGRLSVKAL